MAEVNQKMCQFAFEGGLTQVRRILFVDDEQKVLDGLKRLVRRQGQPWDVSFATGGEVALELLEREPCDVIVSDMRMPGMDGLALLDEIRVRHPRVARIILTGYADLEASLRAVAVAHQYLIKPCDVKALAIAVERACSLQSVLSSATLVRILGSIRDLPCAPSTYAALNGALGDPDATLETIAQIIEQDVGLSAKVLQISSSAFFGMAERSSTVRNAVSHLGVNIIRKLLLADGTFRPSPAGFDVFPMDRFQNHAQAVARIVSTIPLPDHLADSAAVAGLLHDVGELVLASRLPTAFRAAVENARKSQRPLHEVEEEQYGASHAEVGAYLLSLWGFSAVATEAVAHHHHPDRIPHGGMDAVTAVFLANHLAREFEENTERPLSPVLLNDLGIAGQYPAIRDRARQEYARQSTPAMPAKDAGYDQGRSVTDGLTTNADALPQQSPW